MAATCSRRAGVFRSRDRGGYDDAVRYGLRLAVPILLLASAGAIGGCIIDRGALTAPPRPGTDAAGIDAAVPDAYVDTYAAPGTDAWREQPDVSVELPDVVEVPVDATSCDSVGDPCCDPGVCNGGLVCLNDDTCGTVCGNGGESCCHMGRCFGAFACVAGSGTCETCGNPGGPCCSVAPRCVGGHACDGAACVACGGNGQPCCEGSCGGGLDCSDGRCRPRDGTRGGSCLFSTMPCEALSYCDIIGGSICRGCGMVGEGCCPGGGPGCASGLSCRWSGADRVCQL